MIGILNADMFGQQAEPGEHVDWSSPDLRSREDWEDLLECTVEAYAAAAPHMIVFEA